jgi:hypothetical protein
MVTTGDLLGAAGEALRFTEADNGKTVTVPLGRAFEIILLNGRDGAGWEPGASEITGQSVEPVNKLRRGNCDEFMAEKAPTPDSTLGMYKYRYRAVKPGTSNIRLTHLYPSGPTPKPRWATQFIGEFKLTVRVTEAPESGRAIKGDFDPVRMEAAPVVVRAHVKPYVAGSVGSVGPFMTQFSKLIVTAVLKDQGEKTLKAGAEIALAHDQREPLPAGEFTAYLKTETLKLSGKEHVRYNFTGTAPEGSRYPGAGQGTSHPLAGQ